MERIANTVIRSKKLDPWEAARILALVNFGLWAGVYFLIRGLV